MGSLALSHCHLAAGRVDAVVSLKPIRSVDIAAAQLLVRERGLALGLPDVAEPFSAATAGRPAVRHERMERSAGIRRGLCLEPGWHERWPGFGELCPHGSQAERDCKRQHAARRLRAEVRLLAGDFLQVLLIRPPPFSGTLPRVRQLRRRPLEDESHQPDHDDGGGND